MSEPFEVSVVIPVYNAERFVERAIVSALDQEEVKEVVVVDDGYQDDAYEICQQLAKQHNRIKLLTHPNHENKGAATSRNLGILNTTCDYIAFLDADDYFLPERFRFAKTAFAADPSIDAVYEPVGYRVSTDQAMVRLQNIKRAFRESPEKVNEILAYAKTPYTGVELFKSMAIGGNDGPCTDGITVKKSLIASVGLFNTALRLHQDTEYWLRLSYFGKFSPTSNHTQAVAVRDMHDGNRTYAQNNASKFKLWQAVLSWASMANMDKEIFSLILKRYQTLVAEVK